MTAGARGVLVLVALVVVAYLPFIGGGLLTDDFVHLDRLAHASAGDVFNAPDAFGFFRPITQASLSLQSHIHPSAPWLFRLTNVILHGLVLIAAFVVARGVLVSVSAAALATLIFALTPKAHPIAVLWISARGELLMSLFALAATWAWIVWTRGGDRRWLIAAIVAYALAILSKETAFLLPAALLVVPGSTRPRSHRMSAVAAMVVAAGLAFVWRTEAGALIPGTADPHYALATSVFRWSRNARNYLGRLLPVPLAAGVVLTIASVRRRQSSTGRPEQNRGVVIFSVAWISVFLLPVLPVVLRNELYLYLPAFGVATLAAHLIGRWVDLAVRPAMRAAVLVLAISCGAYQASRSWEMHAELRFSGQLVEALAAAPRPAIVSLVAEDEDARQLLKDTIGGYLPAVLRQAAPDGRLIAADTEAADAPGVVRLRCGYHDGRLVIARN